MRDPVAPPAERLLPPFRLGPMPKDRAMITLDEAIVHAPVETIFALAARVEDWPRHLPHYRWVRFRGPRTTDGGGTVAMSANRPFGPIPWPTWWTSYMAIDHDVPEVRFRHIEGVTTGMDVAWTFQAVPEGTHVRLFHVWDGPGIPFLGPIAAVGVIGPVFIRGIASRTLAGLKAVAEREGR